MIRVLRVVWFRFRATFGLRRGGLFAIVLLVGLVGGLAMGAVAGARRTQSSFPAYLARTNASDLVVQSAIYNPQVRGLNTAYDAGIVAKIASLPYVQQVGDSTGVDPNITPLVPHEFDFHMAPGQTPPVVEGSLDGEYSTMDRLFVASGRLADPKRADEVVMSASAARELGMHVGSVLPVGFVTSAGLAQCCNADGIAKHPYLEVKLKLVGIIVENSQIVEDDIDALGNNPVLLTPALTRRIVGCCAYYTNTTIKVDGGSRHVPAVEAELARAAPKLSAAGTLGGAVATSVVKTTAERAIEPESIALGVFGAIAALAVLLIAAQLIGRQVRLGRDEREVLRALGAGPATTVSDGLFGVVAAVAIGAVLAVVVAGGLSRLAPLGPVRHVEHSSFAFDWTVLGLGLVGLVIVLSAVAVGIAYRQAPHLLVRRSRRVRTPRSQVVRATANVGLPAPAVTGIRFAVEPGANPNAVPVRSAIVGAVLAMVMVTSALTFGTSLRTLVSHPSLYGWNWDYEMLGGFSGSQNLPQTQVAALLDHDRYVKGWAGIYFAGADINGHSVPVIGGAPRARVAPPLLSGHGVDAPDQIVLGATTLAVLHKHVGDTVKVNVSNPKPTTLRIVGTATMPAIGNGMTMGTGALVSYQLIPADQRNFQHSPIAGPNAILVRVDNAADPARALHSLQQINDTVSKGPDGPAGGIVSVLRPAEIVNYRTMGSTPALLGAALAVGTVGALMLTLIASVRRRRRELALLKTLGFTRRQLASVVAWQSTIVVGIGIIVGTPIGIVIGRSFWNVFASAIHAVPQPTVPAGTITAVAAIALVLANLIAAFPGLQAARTPTATLLHAE